MRTPGHDSPTAVHTRLSNLRPWLVRCKLVAVVSVGTVEGDMWIWMLACATPSSEPTEVLAGVVLHAAGKGHQLVNGDGTIRPLPEATPFLTTDTIRTGTGVIIVELWNHRLVRLDDDLELRATELILIDAPVTDRPISEQLLELQEPGETFSGVEALSGSERIAGFLAGRTAGHAVGSGSAEGSKKKSSSPEAASPEAMSTSEDADGAAAPPPTAPGAPPPAPALGPPAIQASRPRGAVRGPPSAGKAKESRVLDRDSEAPPTFDLQMLLAEPVIQQCLASWRSALPNPALPLTVELKREAGKVTHATLPGGLTVPRCLRDRLRGAVVEVDTFVLPGSRSE